MARATQINQVGGRLHVEWVAGTPEADIRTGYGRVPTGPSGASDRLARAMAEWETVIGLECHVELSTRTKMFCSCRNEFGAEPNTLTCPVCLGHPGSLPVPNREAIARIVKVGVALGSEIAPRSLFHRKNYFYPDMPKNYQISQFDLPVCVGGHLEVELAGRRTSTVGITRVRMEEESLRCDANISLRPTGARTYGTKVEIKNMNSVRSLERALAFEVERQT